MKTLTAQIDVVNVEKKGDTYIVDYWDEHFYCEHNAKIQISEDSLLDFIVDNDYNLVSYTNYSIMNLECDGLDEKNIDPSDYLAENLNEVIKDYIQANS